MKLSVIISMFVESGLSSVPVRVMPKAYMDVLSAVALFWSERSHQQSILMDTHIQQLYIVKLAGR